jgi:hypothetical protein
MASQVFFVVLFVGRHRRIGDPADRRLGDLAFRAGKATQKIGSEPIVKTTTLPAKTAVSIANRTNCLPVT